MAIPKRVPILDAETRVDIRDLSFIRSKTPAKKPGGVSVIIHCDSRTDRPPGFVQLADALKGWRRWVTLFSDPNGGLTYGVPFRSFLCQLSRQWVSVPSPPIKYFYINKGSEISYGDQHLAFRLSRVRPSALEACGTLNAGCTSERNKQYSSTSTGPGCPWEGSEPLVLRYSPLEMGFPDLVCVTIDPQGQIPVVQQGGTCNVSSNGYWVIMLYSSTEHLRRYSA